MKIEQQVCTVEQARKLQQLGIAQSTSYFCYAYVGFPDGNSWFGILSKDAPVEGTHEADAFTIAELGAMAAIYHDSDRISREMLEDVEAFDSQIWNAQWLADHVIKLIELGYLTVAECNTSLTPTPAPEQ